MKLRLEEFKGEGGGKRQQLRCGFNMFRITCIRVRNMISLQGYPNLNNNI